MKSDLHDVYVIYQNATERAVCIREHEVTGMTDELRRVDIVTLTAPERVLTEKEPK